MKSLAVGAGTALALGASIGACAGASTAGGGGQPSSSSSTTSSTSGTGGTGTGGTGTGGATSASSSGAGGTSTSSTSSTSTSTSSTSTSSAGGSCTDQVKNGAETDVDCGGGTCPTCATGMKCKTNPDCTSNACDAVGLTCASNQCADHHKDGLESDIDCGGGICPKCPQGSKCTVDGDCASSGCDAIMHACAPSVCADHHQDGLETDVDCGGSGGCPPCSVGQKCLTNFDCVSGHFCNASKLCQ